MNPEGSENKCHDRNFCPATEKTDKILQCENEVGRNDKRKNADDNMKSEVNKNSCAKH
jgi:hypothetical protein